MHTELQAAKAHSLALESRLTTAREMLRLALTYLRHPDVLAVTNRMALSGEAVYARIARAAAKL